MTPDLDPASPRILCISPFFAPLANSEAFCSAKMVDALRQAGASVTVIASSNLGAADNSSMWNSVRDSVVDLPLPRRIDRWGALRSTARMQTPLALTRVYTQWADAAVRQALRLHRKNKFNLIYSRSLPMCAHIAGYWCARKLGLPWVANINDPWESNFWPGAEPASALRTWMYLFWLRRVLRRADLITYPCAALHRFHCHLAGVDHAAGIIPHIGSQAGTDPSKTDGRFRLVHAGKLGSTLVLGRNANSLLLGLRAFLDSSPAAAEETTLALVGPEDKETEAMIRELRLERNVESVGRVSYAESMNYIASASACVLLEANIDEGIFLASKLIDYLACGKPVLALSPRAGTAADLGRRGELIRADHDPESVRHAIAGLYVDFQRGTLGSRAPSARQIQEFQPRIIAGQFLSVCEPLLSRTALLLSASQRRQNATEPRTQIHPSNRIPESSVENTR